VAKVFIGVDPHKLSVTIEVVDHRERILATGRFDTDKAGYAMMRKHVAAWPERVWAVEGSNGAGRPLAQRLLADSEQVVDVPAKVAADRRPAGALRGHERQNISRSHILGLLVDHGEEHLQIERRRQHRVRPAPPRHEPQIVIQQRRTQHRRLATRTDQTQLE
jgi:hypothetical protein